MIKLNHGLHAVRRDIHAAYGYRYDADVIDANLNRLIARHLDAVVEDFVPLLVAREAREIFGARRKHVRFAAGMNAELARAAVALTKKHAGEQVLVDAAPGHPEQQTNSALSGVLRERGLGEEREAHFGTVAAGRAPEDQRTLARPDYVVYLGTKVPRDEAGKDIKVWQLEEAKTVAQARELADDVEARVLFMLDKLGIESIAKDFAASA